MLTPHEKILTPFHRELLKRFFRSPVGPRFFLTGGTALAAFYLHHRLSEDLDLFTEEPQQVPQVDPILQQIAKDLDVGLRQGRRLAAFHEVFFMHPNGETIKMDFAQDSPYRLKPVEETPLGIRVDNALDISCNKLSALSGRVEGKDFVDVYFILKRLFSKETLFEKAAEKHVGLDPYWLAMAFQQVEKVTRWPTMIVPCDFSDVRMFFLQLARDLLR